MYTLHTGNICYSEIRFDVRILPEAEISLSLKAMSICPESIWASVYWLNGIWTSEVFFKIKFLYFSGTLTLQIYFLIIQINDFRGEVSDVSAKTATLIRTRYNALSCRPVRQFQHHHFSATAVNNRNSTAWLTHWVSSNWEWPEFTR